MWWSRYSNEIKMIKRIMNFVKIVNVCLLYILVYLRVALYSEKSQSLYIPFSSQSKITFRISLSKPSLALLLLMHSIVCLFVRSIKLEAFCVTVIFYCRCKTTFFKVCWVSGTGKSHSGLNQVNTVAAVWLPLFLENKWWPSDDVWAGALANTHTAKNAQK